MKLVYELDGCTQALNIKSWWFKLVFKGIFARFGQIKYIKI